MATREQLIQALMKADAEGNADDARVLADMIKEQDAQAKKPASTWDEIQRTGGYFGKGFNDTAANVLGAVPDLINTGIEKAAGLAGIDYRPAPPGYYSDAIKSGLKYMLGDMPPPETTLDKAAYGAGGGVAGAASVALPAAAVARAAGGASLVGNVAGTLAAQPAAQAVAGAVGGGVEGATNNPWLGLAAALGVPLAGSAARRAISPVANRLTPEQARLAQVATAEGIPLTPGQATGSRPLKSMESVLATLPLSSNMAQGVEQGQRAAFNRATLTRAGVGADAATPDVIDAQFGHLGNTFNRLSRQLTVAYDPQLGQDLLDTLTRYQTKLPSQQQTIVRNYLRDILQRNAMPGTMYQVTRSDLSRQAKGLANSDPTLSAALRSIRDALDNAADRSMPANLRDEWRQARRDYGNLKVITKAMESGSVDSASGNIPPARLWQGVRNQVGSDRMARGQGDLNDLARVGQAFIKQQIPNSGTPERIFWQRLLTGAGLGLPITGAIAGGGLTGGNLTSAAIGAGTGATALLLPPVIQAFINSPAGRAWLTNQAAAGLGPRSDAALLSAIAVGRGIGSPSMFGGQ